MYVPLNKIRNSVENPIQIYDPVFPVIDIDVESTTYSSPIAILIDSHSDTSLKEEMSEDGYKDCVFPAHCTEW